MIRGVRRERCSSYYRLILAAIVPIVGAVLWTHVGHGSTGPIGAAGIQGPMADSVDIRPGSRTFLEPNAPNPFFRDTEIAYTLATESPVLLRIFDFFYVEVETLMDAVQPAGRHVIRWDPEGPVSTGMYFVELRTAEGTQVRRMIYIR